MPVHWPRQTVVFAFVLTAALNLWQSEPSYARQAKSSNPSGVVPEWSYRGDQGPSRWGEMSSSFAACGSGQAQSPIAIETSRTRFQPCVPLRFRYRSSSLHLVNDGTALRAGYDRGSYLVVDGLSYELVELRFHVPGEHAIDGRVPDGEIEMIHGNNRGDIAIVSVPIVAGNRVNQIFRRILDNAPVAAGTNAYGRNVGVNATFLLPSRRSYFRYRGSESRPPCRERVHRFILDTPLEVATSDLARLAQIAGPNARPTQKLNGRIVDRLCTIPRD